MITRACCAGARLVLAGAAKDVAEKRGPSAHEGHSAAAAENSDELPGGQADPCGASHGNSDVSVGRGRRRFWV